MTVCSKSADQNRELRPTPESIEILGVKVHKVTSMDAQVLLNRMALDSGPHLVITLNSEMIMRAQRDHNFRDIINNASLSLPDAMGIVWASKILGNALPERLAGVDTVERLAERASTSGIRLFLLGAAPGVAERVAVKFQSRYPGLVIAGTFAGSPHPDDEAEICRRVAAAKPHVLLVAYKVPQQEYWIARNMHRLSVPVVINVGGSFDFIAGDTRRAPLWMQEHGLEWLCRLVLQPWRWRRMMVLPIFALKVLGLRFITLFHRQN